MCGITFNDCNTLEEQQGSISRFRGALNKVSCNGQSIFNMGGGAKPKLPSVLWSAPSADLKHTHAWVRQDNFGDCFRGKKLVDDRLPLLHVYQSSFGQGLWFVIPNKCRWIYFTRSIILPDMHSFCLCHRNGMFGGHFHPCQAFFSVHISKTEFSNWCCVSGKLVYSKISSIQMQSIASISIIIERNHLQFVSYCQITKTL